MNSRSVTSLFQLFFLTELLSLGLAQGICDPKSEAEGSSKCSKVNIIRQDVSCSSVGKFPLANNCSVYYECIEKPEADVGAETTFQLVLKQCTSETHFNGLECIPIEFQLNGTEIECPELICPCALGVFPNVPFYPVVEEQNSGDNATAIHFLTTEESNKTNHNAGIVETELRTRIRDIHLLLTNAEESNSTHTNGTEEVEFIQPDHEGRTTNLSRVEIIINDNNNETTKEIHNVLLITKENSTDDDSANKLAGDDPNAGRHQETDKSGAYRASPQQPPSNNNQLEEVKDHDDKLKNVQQQQPSATKKDHHDDDDDDDHDHHSHRNRRRNSGSSFKLTTQKSPFIIVGLFTLVALLK